MGFKWNISVLIIGVAVVYFSKIYQVGEETVSLNATYDYIICK